MSWLERFRRAWDAQYAGPPVHEAAITAAPAAAPVGPQRSRFRVESKDGKTRVVDLKTGEDLSAYCTRVEFVHDAGGGKGKGYPELRITLRDNWDPEALIERTAGWMGRDPRDLADVFARGPAPPAWPDDPARCVAFDPPPAGSPPLLVVADRRPSAEALRNIRAGFRDAIGSGTRAVLFEPGLRPYQLVDGRWQPLE